MKKRFKNGGLIPSKYYEYTRDRGVMLRNNEVIPSGLFMNKKQKDLLLKKIEDEKNIK